MVDKEITEIEIFKFPKDRPKRPHCTCLYNHISVVARHISEIETLGSPGALNKDNLELKTNSLYFNCVCIGIDISRARGRCSVRKIAVL